MSNCFGKSPVKRASDVGAMKLPIKLEKTPRELGESLANADKAGLQLRSCLRSLFESLCSGLKYGSLLFQQHDFNVLSQNNFLWSWRIP